MTSFFEKLKRGMSIKEPLGDIEEVEEEVKKTPAKKPAALKNKAREEKAKPKKLDIKTISIETKKGPAKILSPFVTKTPLYAPVPLTIAADAKEKPEDKPDFVPLASGTAAGKKNWLEQEGELAIDIYQTEQDLVIQSAIAGINPEDLDITMEKDIMTIRGFRKKPLDEEGDYFTKECFWGAFKREIILPAEVDPGLIQATMKEGVLIIRLPKILREKKRVIKIKS